ncbi:cyclic nucleotide-binding domain-containing protein, partial [Clostridioides difficile]|uniref:cyclic nucleotide-binding domain-containing protein n=1 Tax=Clostridioides difficile TaxID=1496 RepID=UPI001C6418C0
EVEVTQSKADGEPSAVLRKMGPAEFFGEIGLLSRVPRKATVTALTDVRAAALSETDFLGLVSEGPGLTYAM